MLGLEEENKTSWSEKWRGSGNVEDCVPEFRMESEEVLNGLEDPDDVISLEADGCKETEIVLVVEVLLSGDSKLVLVEDT